jgi:hypothetical protein
MLIDTLASESDVGARWGKGSFFHEVENKRHENEKT